MTWPFHLFGIASTGRRWRIKGLVRMATFKIGSQVWLVVDKTGKLQVTSTQNQDNLDEKALIQELILAGFREHAYYLGYQYRRKIT
jgi:superoxide dismutase